MPRPTQVPHHGDSFISLTGLSPSSARLSGRFCYECVFFQLHGSSPCGPTTPLLRFGLLRFRSPLLTESLLISFPVLLRWFTSHGLALRHYFIHASQFLPLSRRVTPFGYPRVNGYVPLSAAFRSLSRPSSPYSSTGIRHEPIFPWPYLPSALFLSGFRLIYLFLSPHDFFQSRFPSSLLFLFQRSLYNYSFLFTAVSLWDGIELNYRPPPYQSGALTN